MGKKIDDYYYSYFRTKVGIVADLGTLQRINKLIGSGMVRELAFTGEPLNAERALNCSFVNNVYPDKSTLLNEARNLAKQINSNSPLVVQGTKHIINFSEEHSIDEGLAYVALWNCSFLKSDDLTEAMMSYMQKRPPKFRNKL
jgi:enoyl-CoA hydratase/carnithine racemase